MQQGLHFKVLKASTGLGLLNGGMSLCRPFQIEPTEAQEGFKVLDCILAVAGFQLKEFSDILRLPQE